MILIQPLLPEHRLIVTRTVVSGSLESTSAVGIVLDDITYT